MIKKVVDSNYLQNPSLRYYLSESKENFVVLTEYLAMEAYKEQSGKILLKSIEILKDFPDQVLILNATITICGLIFKPEESLEVLIDTVQTKDFKKFCEALLKPEKVEQFIENHREEAILQMERILNDANKFLDGCKGLLESFTPNELKIIRKKQLYSEEIITKIFKHTLEASMYMFHTHPETKRLPSIDELPHTFIFHNCLCMVLVFVKWVENGSPQVIRQERIRNDIVDGNFASFALYFDGLLTNDDNLNELYNKAKALLRIFKDQLNNV